MRVAMYYSNSDVRVEEMPVPKIGPDELLVKVMASGICGSDVMEWYRLKKAPKVLGHEITGEIVEVGNDVKGYETGQRVFVSHHVPCDDCHYCRSGNHSVCDTLRTTNFDPGGFAEFIRVPAINVDRGIFVLPDEMSFEDGVFIEPLACVVRGQKKAKVYPGSSVIVIGSGISGLLHIQLAKANGAANVFTTDVNEWRLEQAARLGADGTIDAKEDVPERLKELNGGRLADMVIVCTGAQPAVVQALHSVDRGGTILFFAPTPPGTMTEMDLERFWSNGVTITTSYAGCPEDIKEAIEHLRKGDIAVKDMVSHRLDLDDIQKGFDLMTKAGRSMKVVIEPHR